MLTDMSEANQKAGACITWFLANAGTANSSANVAGQRTLEDLMGEDGERKTKLSTAVRIVTALPELQTVQEMLANVQLLLKTFVELAKKKKKDPFLLVLARHLLSEITRSDFRRQLAKVKTSQPHVLHHLVGIADKFVVGIVTFARNVHNIKCVTRNEWSKLDTTALARVWRDFDINITNLHGFCGGDVLQKNILWETFPKKNERSTGSSAKKCSTHTRSWHPTLLVPLGANAKVQGAPTR